MNKKLSSILAVILALAMICVSCSEEETNTPPELPPIDALVIDINDFIDNPSQQGAMKSVETISNAWYAYTTATAWNVIVALNMIVPVYAYLECLNHTPVYLGDNKWQWSASWSGAETYTARLVATRISNDEFTAEMFITLVGTYEDFKWFEGTIRYNRTHAEWTMYKSPEDNVAWLTIDWNMDWEQEVSDITYTIVDPGHEEYGSYITYGITADTDYDAYYTISLSQKLTEIKWNLTTKAGMVRDQVNFQDSEWHCWDELYQDVDCN